MAIEIYAVGGYGEVGKNMTAVKVGEEVVILDMGLHMPNYIKFTEDEREDIEAHNTEELRKAKAIPDDNMIKELRDKVIAIIPSHAHLDHCGAIPFLAQHYKAPIICTNFTAEVIKKVIKDGKIKMLNEIKSLSPNSHLQLTKNTKIEFIHVTHSTPQTTIVAIHTPEGIVVYANDFKLDNSPTLGKKTNYAALEKLAEKGVKLAIIDSLYANEERKTPSENIAKEMLKDVLLESSHEGKAIILTTFSSHIARLKSATEMGIKIGRKVIILGRSMSKYVFAAEDAGVAYLTKEAEVIKYKRKAINRLAQIEKEGKHKYLIIMTGHQGEKNAMLNRIATQEIPFKLTKEDHIIFSCNVIPTPINIKQRQELEKRLKTYGVRIFKDVHVSGHGSREDMRELIKILKPQHIIPAHSEKDRIESFTELSQEMDYKKGKNLHQVYTGDKLIID